MTENNTETKLNQFLEKYENNILEEYFLFFIFFLFAD